MHLVSFLGQGNSPLHEYIYFVVLVKKILQHFFVYILLDELSISKTRLRKGQDRSLKLKEVFQINLAAKLSVGYMKSYLVIVK